MSGNISISSFIEGNNHYDGTNFPEWDKNLRIVLGQEKLLYVLDSEVPQEPPQDDIVAWRSWSNHHNDSILVQSIMLAGMTLTFRRQCKNLTACQIMVKLQNVHSSSDQAERYNISKRLFRSRMQEGMSVEEHVSEMMADIDRLSALNVVQDPELYVDLVLQSLPDSWSGFVKNYNKLGKKKTLRELMTLLKEAEPEINEGRMREAYISESSEKGRGMSSSSHSGDIRRAQGASVAPGVADYSQDACLYCGKAGHSISDCRKYKRS